MLDFGFKSTMKNVKNLNRASIGSVYSEQKHLEHTLSFVEMAMLLGRSAKGQEVLKIRSEWKVSAHVNTSVIPHGRRLYSPLHSSSLI